MIQNLEKEVVDIFKFINYSDTITHQPDHNINKDIKIKLEEKSLEDNLNEIKSNYLNIQNEKIEKDEKIFLDYDEKNKNDGSIKEVLPEFFIHKIHPEDSVVSLAISYGVECK
jgi:hypothetical protein